MPAAPPLVTRDSRPKAQPEYEECRAGGTDSASQTSAHRRQTAVEPESRFHTTGKNRGATRTQFFRVTALTPDQEAFRPRSSPGAAWFRDRMQKSESRLLRPHAAKA